MAFLKTLFDANAREVARLRRTAERVNALEPATAALSDDELRAKTAEFKARLEQSASKSDDPKERREAEKAALDALLPEAFAVVREAGKRVLGMRHFDVQIMGGQALHEGNVAEMSTGEGKTLVATLPVYLNALTGKGVHLVTVNDYLAKRDAEWMGPLYEVARPDGRHHPARPRPQRAQRRLQLATSPTSPTTRSGSTTCATTWRGRSTRWCSATSTSRSSTKSTRSSSTRRARRSSSAAKATTPPNCTASSRRSSRA